MTKFVFVTGGVVSSIGKGIVAASLGRLLKSRGYNVSILKLDPYLNVDPGTMSPFQHGEVFVTEDGAETDLDLGHYERFVRFQASKKNNFTAGKVYEEVIQNEKRESSILEIQSFLGAIEGKNEPIIKAQQAVNVTKIAEAALLSSQKGIPIYLDLK